MAAEADLVYSRERPDALSETGLWIAAGDVSDWNSPQVEVSWHGELPILHYPGTGGAASTADVAPDIVYSTYALVTGALEREQRKDPWGVPIAEDSFLGKAGLLQYPVVAMYCSYLASMLRRRNGALEQVPLWPGGKKYAIVLSHDVDAPFRRAPWSFYLRRLRNHLTRPAPRLALRGVVQMAKIAALTRLAPMKPALEDPNFCFEQWLEIEGSLPAASCFYVAVTTSADRVGSPVDVEYDFRQPDLADQLRRAVERGWEVGLHASVNARTIPGRFAEEKSMLESVLGGYHVKGLRHHFWALDPQLPERIFWQHAEAGLTYDSSLGLNDAPGFRRGMIWPFHPFDPERGVEIPLLEVPPTLMDGGIFYRSVTPEAGYQQIKDHLRQVAGYGGAAVLDWHMEQLNPARLGGAGPILVRVLKELASDSDIYWATPAQISSWWQTRRKQLDAIAR
jgi:hypothetical protein